MTGEAVIKVREALKAQRQPFETHWDELATIFTPFKRVSGECADLLDADMMFDSTPRHSAEIFANGLCSLIVPREDVWMEFVPPKSLAKDDEAVKFYREASETTREYLDASNFYEEIQESLIESPGFGTCSLYCGELDERGELCFLHQPIGTYYLGEDAKGRVNAHCRDMKLTADQAAEEFGETDLPRDIASKVGKPAGMTDKFDFIHLVMRRRGPVENDAPESDRRPWLDIVVEMKSKKVVRKTGAYEFPFAAHRYRKYGKSAYGFGPGYLAKGDARQLSFLNELADLGTEKEVFPPLLASADLEGEVAQGALEITYQDPNNPNAMVKELHSQGKMSTLQWRMEGKQLAIEKAFHVDLFKLFSNRAQERGPLTATEASLISGEKLTQFSPVYGRIMSEMVEVILLRVFSVLYRAGRFGQAPASVAEIVEGKARVVAPSITYRNRIALAMKAKENGALMQFFEVMLPVLTAFPQMAEIVWMALESDVLIRDLLRNAGTPERWIAALRKVQERQAAVAAAREQQAKLEQAETASGVAKNISALPPQAMAQMQQRTA